MNKWIYTIAAVCLFVYMCGGSEECGETAYEGRTECNQTSEISNKQQAHVSFSAEYNVRDYLNSHRFVSSSGYTLTFLGGTNEMSVNGQILSNYVEIVSFSRTSAVLRTNGPSGKITLYLDAANGVLTEESDGTRYYAK